MPLRAHSEKSKLGRAVRIKIGHLGGQDRRTAQQNGRDGHTDTVQKDTFSSKGTSIFAPTQRDERERIQLQKITVPDSGVSAI